MPRQREAPVQRAVLAALRLAGAYAISIHGGPMQPAAIDVFVCYQGRFVGLEIKSPRAHRITDFDAPDRQRASLWAIRTAGGVAGVVDDVGIVKRMLAHWPHVCSRCLEGNQECVCV